MRRALALALLLASCGGERLEPVDRFSELGLEPADWSALADRPAPDPDAPDVLYFVVVGVEPAWVDAAAEEAFARLRALARADQPVPEPTDRIRVSASNSTADVATLLTGLEPETHGLRSPKDIGAHRLRSELPTVATVLRAAGYATCASVALPQLRPSLTGFDRGFDTYRPAGIESALQVAAPATVADRLIADLESVPAAARPRFAFAVLALPRFETGPLPAGAAGAVARVADAFGDEPDARALVEAGDIEGLRALVGRRRGAPERDALAAALQSAWLDEVAAAVDRVRRTLGDDTVVVGTDRSRGLAGSGFEAYARPPGATDPPEPVQPRELCAHRLVGLSVESVGGSRAGFAAAVLRITAGPDLAERLGVAAASGAPRAVERIEGDVLVRSAMRDRAFVRPAPLVLVREGGRDAWAQPFPHPERALRSFPLGEIDGVDWPARLAISSPSQGRAAPLRLDLSAAGSPLGESQVVVGDTPLPEVMLPRLPDPRGPEWPEGEPRRVELESIGGGWVRVTLRRREGESDPEVTARFSTWPALEPGERVPERAPTGGDADALGRWELRPGPGKRLAVAIAVDGACVPAREMCVDGRRGETDVLSIVVPGPDDPACAALFAPDAEPPEGTLRITRVGPPFPVWQDLAPADRALLEKLPAGE